MAVKARQVLLLTCLLWLSWLTMMLVHEAGHVIGALLGGGTIVQVVWHPGVLSRTDVSPNPDPLLEVWSGPLVGSVVPCTLACGATLARLRVAYLVWFFAAFCLIANGTYLGSGSIDAVGDAKQLIALGTPRWLLAIFGSVTVVPGLWIWHCVSGKLGFGGNTFESEPRHLYGSAVTAAVMTAIGFIFGNAGR